MTNPRVPICRDEVAKCLVLSLLLCATSLAQTKSFHGALLRRLKSADKNPLPRPKHCRGQDGV